MPSPEKCIQEAERCERTATSAHNDKIRRSLNEVAATWREMAESKARVRQRIRLMDIGAAFRLDSTP